VSANPLLGLTCQQRRVAVQYQRTFRPSVVGQKPNRRPPRVSSQQRRYRLKGNSGGTLWRHPRRPKTQNVPTRECLFRTPARLRVFKWMFPMSHVNQQFKFSESGNSPPHAHRQRTFHNGDESFADSKPYLYAPFPITSWWRFTRGVTRLVDADLVVARTNGVRVSGGSR
jgi:hypothetical protein